MSSYQNGIAFQGGQSGHKVWKNLSLNISPYVWLYVAAFFLPAGNFSGCTQECKNPSVYCCYSASLKSRSCRIHFKDDGFVVDLKSCSVPSETKVLLMWAISLHQEFLALAKSKFCPDITKMRPCGRPHISDSPLCAWQRWWKSTKNTQSGTCLTAQRTSVQLSSITSLNMWGF